MLKKSWVILPDFREAIFTLKDCFGLNSPEMNKTEGERESRRRPHAAGGHGATMLSLWLINHLRVMAGVRTTRRHHGTAAQDRGQAPTE